MELPGFDVSMMGITDIPGLSLSLRPAASSITIFTEMRCTTFVKFPVALSGGRSENCAPEAGA